MFAAHCPVLAAATPATALVRAAGDPEQPPGREQSQSWTDSGPRVQMGAGPTALAMVALMVALVGQTLRRRRARASVAD